MAFQFAANQRLRDIPQFEDSVLAEDQALFRGLAWTARVLVTALLVIVIVLSVRAAEAAPQAPGGPEAFAGLFFKSGEAGQVYEAPNLESEVEIDIAGQVARVTVRQDFKNPSGAWLEGVYVFPLPERSAVDRLVMTVGDRRIEGEIMEREEAQKVYEQAAKRGQKASLLSSARPNVFVTSVANIGPGETITIEIGYQDRIGYEQGRMSYRFPMVVAPRYTPAPIREMVRAKPTPLNPTPLAPTAPEPGFREIAMSPETDKGDGKYLAEGRDLFGPVQHPDLGPINPVSLQVSLNAGRPIADLESPSHAVVVRTETETRAKVTLAKQSIPADRDFVLQWRPEVGGAPEAALFAEEVGGSTYLLVDLLPPSVAKQIESEEPALPRDLVIILDRSGSMAGQGITQAKDALALALKSLRPVDGFNIISFASDTTWLFESAKPATEANLRGALLYVDGLEAGGGTEMQPALLRALQETKRPGTLRQVVFLTDGGVSNERQLFLDIARHLGPSRLFTVGLGSAPNGYFMRRAAELGRGSFVTISNPSQVADRMAALFRRLEQPQITDVEVTWPAYLAGKVKRQPAVLPDLYADQPIRFSARLPDEELSDLSGDLVISAKRAGETWQRAVPLADLRSAKGISSIWARERFAEIEDQAYRGIDPETIRQEALPLALEHRLVTRYTSLVAVDPMPVRPDEIALRREEIARNLPAGMSFDKVFGEPREVMQLRPVPGPLLRDAAFRDGEALLLPQTATSAPLLLLLGTMLLLVGLMLVAAARRLPRLAA